MLNDFFFNTLSDKKTFIHQIDPRLKLIFIINIFILLFICNNILSYSIIIFFIMLMLLISKITFYTIYKNLKSIFLIILVTGFLNLFFIDGTSIKNFYIFNLTIEGIIVAVFISYRILLLLLSTSILTHTTSPIIITKAIENLLNPLKKIGLPIHEFSMIMSISLRFIPTLLDEINKIIKAQESRGMIFNDKNLIKKIKKFSAILIPLFFCIFRRSNELAVAMECKLYRGDINRTNYKKFKIKNIDLIFCLFLFLINFIVLNLKNISW